MRNLIALTIWLAAFVAATANANELTFDPTLPGQKTLTITCDFNLMREDNTPMVIGEIAYASYYISTNNGPFINANVNTPTCRQVFDMTQLADAKYIYAVTETDTDGRESVHSLELVTALVKRLSLPKSPTGLTGGVN